MQSPVFDQFLYRLHMGLDYDEDYDSDDESYSQSRHGECTADSIYPFINQGHVIDHGCASQIISDLHIYYQKLLNYAGFTEAKKRPSFAKVEKDAKEEFRQKHHVSPTDMPASLEINEVNTLYETDSESEYEAYLQHPFEAELNVLSTQLNRVASHHLPSTLTSRIVPPHPTPSLQDQVQVSTSW